MQREEAGLLLRVWLDMSGAGRGREGTERLAERTLQDSFASLEREAHPTEGSIRV